MFGSIPSSMARLVGVFMSQSTRRRHILLIRDICINLGEIKKWPSHDHKMWWFRQSAIGNFVTHVIRVALLCTHNAPTSFVLRQSRNSDWQRRRCLPPAAPRSSRQPAPATGWRRAAASERRSHSSESAGLTPSPLLRRLTWSTNIKFYNTVKFYKNNTVDKQ